MVLMRYSGARGTLIYEKNLKSKISCQTPFKTCAKNATCLKNAKVYAAFESILKVAKSYYKIFFIKEKQLCDF
jgi:hypothetical protein